ncbi:hypothetical protein [Nostoc flagelliforme]|nr:hypothetical protein [Nostoc flagelliforme]
MKQSNRKVQMLRSLPYGNAKGEHSASFTRRYRHPLFLAKVLLSKIPLFSVSHNTENRFKL